MCECEQRDMTDGLLDLEIGEDGGQVLVAHIYCMRIDGTRHRLLRVLVDDAYHQRNRRSELAFAMDYRAEFGPLEQIREHAPHLLGA